MKLVTIILSIALITTCQGQKYDYRWILSDPYSGGSYIYPGNFDIVFTPNNADTISTFYRMVSMENSQTTISDSSGNLIFYSNGAKIYDRRDSIMENGDSINYGWWWDYGSGYSYPFIEDIIGLPTDSANLWNIIHLYVEEDVVNVFTYPRRIYESRIDLEQNAGNGVVLFKNKTLLDDTLGPYVTACKHANGRDWWLLINKTYTNCLYELLITPDTVIECGTQCLGGTYLSAADDGQAAFSPDGKKFAWDSHYAGVNIYDFDRCSGKLSNSIMLPLYATPDSGIYQYGMAFSPNSRFLYVAQSRHIIQFDTQADSIWNSLDTVGTYTGSPNDSIEPGYFYIMQLAPDGKIYVSSNNGIPYLHVINQPDSQGFTPCFSCSKSR